ncbi:MAG TPA: hypothetical protein PLH57_11255, partial [Oligoflexia bacterium]|nr:hypothetical protein [Oligoflexia bacterium]
GKPHQVFLKQHRRYLNRTGQSVLTANLFPEKKYRRIFAPYQEHRLGGKRVRVVGISLETFFQETAYSQTGARIFKTEAPRKYLDTMKEQSVLAANDGVESVVFLIHDGAARLTPIVEEYLNWKRSDDRVQKLLVPLVASGHMHQVIDSELHGTRVVEAGSDLAFSEIQLDDNGKVSLVHHWDRRSSDQWLQQPTEPLLPEAFTELYKEANAIVDSVNAENVEILAPPLWEDRGFVLNREEHRRMRVGRVLADTLRNWALKFYSEKEVGRKISDVVGLYNYLSYGWGSKIDALFEGPVTVGNLKSVVHFRGRLGARLLKGADFLELVAAMRDYGAQSSRPFPNPVLSSNVVERDRRFLITDLNGTVRVVDPNGFYLVVTDHYTGMNGYKIPEIDGIYQRAEWTLNDAPVNTEVLLPGLARLRLSEDSCAGVLSNFRK